MNEAVDEVEIPGAEGYFGVLPGHTPVLALLGAGELWYRQGTEKQFLSIAFGFAEVQPDDAAEGVDHLEPAGGGARDQQPAVVGAEIHRGVKRLRPRRPTTIAGRGGLGDRDRLHH